MGARIVMITLTAKIKLLSSENSGTLSSGTINNDKSNISANFNNIIGVKKKGSNPFILGASKLGTGATFSNGESYYIGNIPANTDGIFIPFYTISVSGSAIKALTIVFDDYNNQYPTQIIVDGETYINDDPNFTVAVNEADSHTITITNWNTPNFPLRIQGIFVDLEVNVNKNNIVSIERSIFDRSDTQMPSYGIISNSGNIEFKDLDGEIKEYAEMNLLQSGINIQIYINNTLTKNNQLIASFDSSEWNYDNDNRQVTLSIKDDLEEWQEINIDGINYDPRYPEPQNLKYFYNYLYDKTPANYKMFSFEELDTTTQEFLTNTYIQYPLLEAGTLWNCWDKLCQVAQSRIYKTNEGRTAFTYLNGD